MSEWIYTKDRLPDGEGPWLVSFIDWYDTQDITIAYFSNGGFDIVGHEELINEGIDAFLGIKQYFFDHERDFMENYQTFEDYESDNGIPTCKVQAVYAWKPIDVTPADLDPEIREVARYETKVWAKEWFDNRGGKA